MRRKVIIRESLRAFRLPIALWLAMCLSEVLLFVLYRLPAEPLCYCLILNTVAALIAYAVVLCSTVRKAHTRYPYLKTADRRWQELPDGETLTEQDYMAMLRQMGQSLMQATEGYHADHREMTDYFTAWVHQIKTPIAVMRMRLAQEDTKEHRELLAELFRIEQYVDMVLQYIRLGTETNDLVIEKLSLDEIIRSSARKYASQFVTSKTKLHYSGTDAYVITDGKWLSVILDQLLSNAAKYASGGNVTVTAAENRLTVSDDGIGISPEDLPRIFERGYTGINGRLQCHSSGLGLYLCKKAADKLSVKIEAQSVPGKGSTFTVSFPQ